MFSTEHELLSQFSTTYFCKDDRMLSLLGDTSGIAHLFGYTVEEISMLFRNRLTAMVPVDARRKLQCAIAEQLANGDDTECIFPVRHKNGSIVWVVNRSVRHQTADGNTYICGILVEITKSKQNYDIEKASTYSLEEKAKKDSLTLLYNAYTARKLAESYIEESTDKAAALLIIDLDDFKRINDQYGHMFGDAVLVQAAKIIKHTFRNVDVVGRIGGDEIMVLMKGTADMRIIANRCKQLNESLGAMFGDQIPDCKPSCSIGIALFPKHADSYFDLFCHADHALYHAKARGKQQYALYNPNSCGVYTGRFASRATEYDENMLYKYIGFDKSPG